MKIRGTKAIVVGGASGMARATAEMLVREGARVAILDREVSQGEQAATAMGGGTRFYRCDVTDFAGTEAALKCAADDLGDSSSGSRRSRRAMCAYSSGRRGHRQA